MEKQKAAETRRIRAAMRARAVTLYEQGLTYQKIGAEMNIKPTTAAKWIKDAGVAKPTTLQKTTAAIAEAIATHEELQPEDVFAARDREIDSLLEVAKNQASPADQYQAFIAAAGIRMMRDSLRQVRGPRTVKELSELDQIIRRSMGLNPTKGGDGKGGLTIDISILNNTKPVPLSMSGITVDAKIVEAEEDEE